MYSAQTEKLYSRIVAIGLAVTILIVTTFISIEPVNSPKMLMVAIFGFGAWAALLSQNFRKNFFSNRALFSLVIIFALISFVNIFVVSAPSVQTFYGTFGRSTGVLTYISLAGLLLMAASFREKSSFNRIIVGIVFAGGVNLVYCGIDILGPDLLGWNNIYGEILGTLGNPNFISAFLGIFSCLLFPFILDSSTSIKLRLISILAVLVAVLEIVKSQSRQGLIVYIAGLVICIYFLLASKPEFRIISRAYFFISSLGAFFAFLGLFQIGPLAQYVYKNSISFRRVYWDAGIEMGKAHPFTGIGFDSFGDYYREFRSAEAMISPGPTITTNTAHNVPIDIFAAGGFPLLICYLLIMLLGFLAVIRIFKSSNGFDPTGIALVVAWLGYQLQSLISINQVGLAACGWLLTGALIGYSKLLQNQSPGEKIASSSAKGKVKSSAGLTMALGGIIGFAVALPPIVVDANWKTTLENNDGLGITKVATQWPKDSYRITQIAIALERSGLVDQSLVLARENVKFNPRFFDTWKVLSQVTKSTPEEKARSIEMMRKLDPLNIELK